MTNNVRRFDRSEVGPVQTTPQGFLRLPVFATRVGVFNYKTADGRTIRELRPEEEVFKADSLATLADAPVTLRHPPVMVTSDNVDQYLRGYVSGTVKQDGDKVAGMAIVSHADAIKAVKVDGLREVSCGYLADLEMTPGVWKGQPYDCIQRNIRYNHLAIVDQGRAGPEVRLRLDAGDAVIESMSHQPPTQEKPMTKITLAGQEFEVDQKVADALKAHNDAADKAKSDAVAAETKKIDGKQAEIDAAKSNADKAQAKADSLASELEKAKSERKDSLTDEQKRAMVKDRIELEKVAAYLGVEKADTMSDLELKKAVIVKDAPKADLTGKSEHYVAARFDTVAEQVRERADFNKVLGASIASGTRADGADGNDADAARKRMMERDNKAWKPGEQK